MSSMKKRNSFLLVLTAFIWGVAFVAQRVGGETIGPYTFNFLRFLIGAAVLIPAIRLSDAKNPEKKPHDKKSRKTLWIGGCSCGLVLFIAANLQQLGLYYGTTAGKAGFLTACYIVLVPILSIFLRKKCSWNIWLGVAITLAGLYFLCMNGSFSLQFSDVLVLICALVFAVHILVIDHFSPLVDGVRMSCIQFLVAGLLSCIPAFFVDMKHSMPGILQQAAACTEWQAWIPLLYAGILSCGVAYTLQIIGQKGLNPTVASLLMSLESVFSVLAGVIILQESLSRRELLGCVMIFAAVILAQIPITRSIEKC